MDTQFERTGELEQMFWCHVPKDYARGLVQIISTAYEDAWIACSETLGMEPPEAENTCWSVRRAFIEQRMRDLAKTFPGMEVDHVLGRDLSPATPWNHTRIVSGRVSFTQACVQHSDDLPVVSHSRATYSLPNHQQFLFPEMAAEAPREDAVLFAVIAHGRDPRVRGKLGFLVIRFPKPGAAEYYESRIDLLDRFPESLTAIASYDTDVENINLPPEPMLKDMSKAQ